MGNISRNKYYLYATEFFAGMSVMAVQLGDPDRLYLRLVTAALWLAAIPLVGKYVILGISGVLVLTVNHNFLILAGFAACMVIFVFPLFLLGTVTPTL